MNPARAVLGAGEGLLDRLLCVLGAVAFSQMPEFMQQYLQRLGGHLGEARRQIQQFENAADQSGITLDRLIEQTTTNADAAVAKLGGVMTEAVARADTLETSYLAIQNASLWSRPFVFIQHADSAILNATWSIFKPAVPTTVEGLIYAITGMLVFIGVYHLGIKYPVRAVYVRCSHRRPQTTEAARP